MTEFSAGRRETLRNVALVGAAVAGGALLASSCSANTSFSKNGDYNSSPQYTLENTTSVYVQSWDSAATLRQQRADLLQSHPGLAKFYFAFGEPDQHGNIRMPEMDPSAIAAFKDLITDLGNLPIALSVGGYGGDDASHQALLAGWTVALAQPEAFVRETDKARARLAGMLGRRVADIGLDIDFEFPAPDQKEKLTALMNRLRGRLGKTALTMALPARDNQEGYDISKLEPIVDGINLMTYAYDGGSGTPKMVADDVEALANQLKNPRKLIVGYSTDTQADPHISNPAAMGQIHQAIGARGIQTGGSFVWRSNGLTSEALRQLSLGVVAG